MPASRPRRLAPVHAAILPLAALAAAAPAGAQSVTTKLVAKGSYRLGSTPTQLLGDSLSGPDLAGSYVDVLRFPSDGANSAGLHSYGYAEGDFGSRSSGVGDYLVTGGFRIRQTVTNAGPTAANAFFNFYVTPGALQNAISGTLTGTDSVRAGIAFDVRRYNGATSTSVFASSATLRATAASGGPQFSYTGANLYTPGSVPSYVAIGGQSLTVDLGTVGAGESFEFEYLLDTYAAGHALGGEAVTAPEQRYTVPEQFVRFACYSNSLTAARAAGGPRTAAALPPLPCVGGGGTPDCMSAYGPDAMDYTFADGEKGCRIPEHEVVVPEHTTIDGQPSGSHVSSGDPFDIGSDGVVVTRDRNPTLSGFVQFATVNLATVPEPGTTALTLGGLGALAAVVRRRRRAG